MGAMKFHCASLWEEHMGKVNIFTVLTVTVLQILVGYLWYSPHFFGDVITVTGGVNYMKTDILSLLLIVLSSYGLTHIFDLLIKSTGTKDISGGIKLGLVVGTFGIGLPMLTLLNLLGFTKVVLLVVFTHMVLIGILTSLVIIKLKKV
jgi:hypothetical protein